MRHLLVWSFATLILLALPAPVLACGNSMHRQFEGGQRMLVRKSVQERAWTSIAKGELEDPYTLTLLAVIRLQAGDTTGGRRALHLAETLRGRKDLGDTVCCVAGERPLGHGFGGIDLGTIGQQPKM